MGLLASIDAECAPKSDRKQAAPVKTPILTRPVLGPSGEGKLHSSSKLDNNVGADLPFDAGMSKDNACPVLAN